MIATKDQTCNKCKRFTCKSAEVGPWADCHIIEQDYVDQIWGRKKLFYKKAEEIRGTAQCVWTPKKSWLEILHIP
jgi:hypothetical protein